MMRPVQKLLISLLFATALLQGCNFLKEAIGLGPRRPKVQVYSIELNKVSLLSIEMLVTVLVENPNDFALKFSRLRYNLTAENLPVAEGVYASQLSVPPGGSSFIKLPLKVNATSLMKLVQLIADGQKEPVAVIAATADFETPLGTIEVDFNDSRPLRKMAGLRH